MLAKGNMLFHRDPMRNSVADDPDLTVQLMGLAWPAFAKIATPLRPQCDCKRRLRIVFCCEINKLLTMPCLASPRKS
jgi:hypothetical protein